MEKYPTFPVNRQLFQVSVGCWAATSLRLDTWNLSETQGNVFGNPRPIFNLTQTPHQGTLHSTNPSATGSIPVQVSTGRLVARGGEQIASTTPMPMSARRPSTWINSVVEMSYVQSRIHSDYDSAESIADWDLEDGELRKMLASPLYVHGRGEHFWFFSQTHSFREPEAKVTQKRGASAHRAGN